MSYKVIAIRDGVSNEYWVRDSADALRWKKQLEAKGYLVMRLALPAKAAS